MQAAAARKPAQGFETAGAWLAFVWSTVPALVLVVLFASGWVSERVALILFAISFVGLNLMHMGATWTRVYVRPGWQTNPTERLIVPLALVVFALAFEAIGGGALLLVAQYFLSFHHALMQNYGIVRASQRRTGRAVDTRLDMAACLLLPGAALLYRAGAICSTYAGAVLPAPPAALIALMAAGGAVALGVFAAREWRTYRRGERVDPIGAGIFLGTNLMWSGLLIADAHPAIPLYAFASSHYVQYLYFVWRVEGREPAWTPGQWARSFVRTEMRLSATRYLLILLAMGGAATVLLCFFSAGLRGAADLAGLRPAGALQIPVWAAAMIGINLEHYWLDHRIWRSPRPAAVAAAVAA